MFMYHFYVITLTLWWYLSCFGILKPQAFPNCALGCPVCLENGGRLHPIIFIHPIIHDVTFGNSRGIPANYTGSLCFVYGPPVMKCDLIQTRTPKRGRPCLKVRIYKIYPAFNIYIRNLHGGLIETLFY